MKKYEILGQHNYLLAMVFEAIYKTDKEAKVNVIHFEEKPFDLFCGAAYAIPEIKSETTYIKNWLPLNDHQKFVLAEGSRERKSHYDLLQNQYHIGSEKYTSIIHPSASIASTATIEPGCYIGPNSSVGPYACIKKGCWINRNVSVGHHTILGEFVTLNPGCNIGGKCTIGECVTIGMGANVFDHVIIGGFAVIGGGSVVTKSLAGEAVFYGSPAKLVRKINL